MGEEERWVVHALPAGANSCSKTSVHGCSAAWLKMHEGRVAVQKSISLRAVALWLHKRVQTTIIVVAVVTAVATAFVAVAFVVVLVDVSLAVFLVV